MQNIYYTYQYLINSCLLYFCFFYTLQLSWFDIKHIPRQKWGTGGTNWTTGGKHQGPICETILLHLREKIIIVHPNTIRRVETGWNLPRSAKIGQESVTILREIWHCCHHSFKPKHEKDYHNTEGVCSKDYLRNINLVWYYMFKEIDFYLLGMKSLLFCWQITFLPQK